MADTVCKAAVLVYSYIVNARAYVEMVRDSKA